MRQGPVIKDTSSVALGMAQIRIGKSSAHIATTAPVLVADDSMGGMASTAYTGETEYWNLESGFPLQIDAVFPLRETNIIECGFKEITPKNLAIARGIDPLADLSATVVPIGSSTIAGTTNGSVAVTDDAGPTTETWTVVFSSAVDYDVYGSVSGHVGAGDTSTQFAPANGSSVYFTIPSTYFTGTWAADETHTFATTAFVAGTDAYVNPHAGAIPLGAAAAPEFVRVEAVYTFPDGVHTMTIIFPRANVTSSLNLDMQAEDAMAVTTTITACGASSDNSGGNAVWDSMPMGQILFQ